jgi:hypothetical protein
MNTFLSKTILYSFFTLIIYILFSLFTFKYELDIPDRTSKLCSEREIGLNRNLIIGDSRALSGIDPTKLSNHYYNISIAGSTFFEGYYQLKKILKFKQIDTIVLCYGQTHFEHSDYLETLMKSCRNIYSKEIISHLSNAEFATNSVYTNKNKNISTWIQIRRLLIYYCLLNRNKKTIDIIRTFLNKQKPNDESISSKGHIILGQDKCAYQPNQEFLESEFKMHPIIEIYLNKINQLCMQKKIKVFFISPPISKLSYKNDNYYKQFDKKIKEIKKKSYIIFLNSTLVYDNNFFGDPSHLNKIGCDKFTNELLEFTSSKSNQIHQGSN